MNEWLELEPVGNWARVDKRRNAVSFEHSQTDDILIVFRILGPYGNTGEYTESYALRHIPASDSTKWTDIKTSKNISKIKDKCRQEMKRLSPSQQWSQ